MSTWQDEGRRGRFAVAISVLEEPGAPLRVFFDDVKRDAREPNPTWRHDVFVTVAEMTPEKLKHFDFTEEELAGLGRMVATELKLFAERREGESQS